MSVRQPSRFDLVGALLGTVRLIGIAALSALVGAALIALSARFGEFAPMVVLGLVIVPMVGFATVIDPRVGVIAVFATFPVGSIAAPLGPFDLEVAQVAVLAVASVVAVGRLAAGRTALPWPSQMWWILALIAWTLVGLPSAVDQSLAIKQIAALILGTLFACVVVGSCRSMRDVKVILVGFAAIAVVIGLGALVQGANFQSTFGGTRVSGRAVSSFDHSNQLGTLSAMSALIVITLVAGARTARARWIGIAAVLVLLAGQALTLSRGAWIGTMVGILFLAVALKHARRALVAISIPMFLVGGAIAILAPDSTQVQVIQQRFESLTVRSPYDDRTAIWQEAQREIEEEPVTGQGAGGFPAASTRAASGANTVFAYHAHNIFLTWAAETGIVGLALIVGFAISLGMGVRRARRRAREESPDDNSYQAVTAGMSAALVALLAQGLVDYTLRNAVIFFAVMGVVGCLIAAIRMGPDEDGDQAESA